MTWADQDLASGVDTAESMHGSLGDFVRDWLAPTYRRDLTTGKGRVWCADWWRHDEAVQRLSGLWRAFEAAEVSDSPTALVSFWRDCADPTMDRLLSETGPFSACRKGHSERLAPLPDGEGGSTST